MGKGPFFPVIVGAGRTRVKLDFAFQGDDLVLRITGGKAHVGAVAVWDRGRESEGPRVTELPNHREGPLAADCAEIVGHATGRTVVAVAGIHQDAATRVEIDSIVAHAKQGAEMVAEQILQRNGNPDDR